MDPLLTTGDRAKIIPATRYSKGGLYLFELPGGSLAIHRLINKSERCATMKGDRSRGFEIVPYQNILGMVSEVKLLDGASWSTINQTHPKRMMISYLSSKLAKDKNIKNENKFNLLINKVCSKILLLLSGSTRKSWKNCGLKSRRHD